jgi:hypothetical protein
MRGRWFAAVAALSLGGVAQQPVPAGEARPAVASPAKTTAAPWPDRDAKLLSLLLAQRRELLTDADARQGRVWGKVWDMGGDWCAIFAADEAGDVALPHQLAAGQPFCIACWPQSFADGHRRALLVHSDGPTMVCDVEGDAPGPLTAAAIVARGSDGTFRDVLRQPGTSANGQLWLWLDQLATTATLTVVDERGAPRAGFEAFVGMVGPDFRAGTGIAAPVPLPVAIGTTGADGTVKLRGPLGATPQIWLNSRDGAVVGARVHCEASADGLRLVVPDGALLSRRAIRNEAAAIATLKNLSSAQAQCQACAKIDANNNGAGEYGFFGELTGAQPLRSDGKGGVGTAKLSPPVLSTAFARVQQGRVERRGYMFQVFLPAPDASPVSENATGGSAGVAVDPTRAEVLWCAYAWPADDKSGLRTFFVNQSGDVLATTGGRQDYVGSDRAPKPDAAFAQGTAGKLDEKVAAYGIGIDGATWEVVN